jgi:hypothetical protein
MFELTKTRSKRMLSSPLEERAFVGLNSSILFSAQLWRKAWCYLVGDFSGALIIRPASTLECRSILYLPHPLLVWPARP